MEATRPPLVVTTCSAGKRIRGDAQARSVAAGDQRTVAAEWLQLLGREQPTTAAERLYKGRAFATVRLAATICRGDLGVLSAGLGFVRGDALIPAYDLTIRSGAPGSITDRISGAFAADAWWSAVSKGPFAMDMAASFADRSLVLLCLSRSYLAMVEGALIEFESVTPGRLRIFGMSLDRYLPPQLRYAFMPYDARLETLGPAGTRTDFAARALLEFVRHISLDGDAATHANAVEQRLAHWTVPPVRAQRRGDDETLRIEIKSLIAAGVRGTRVLARLRAERGWSCEQRRFAGLYKQILKEGMV